jgi:hypothetical protein
MTFTAIKNTKNFLIFGIGHEKIPRRQKVHSNLPLEEDNNINTGWYLFVSFINCKAKNNFL